MDDWLWFLAIENIFADDDSYWNKGADYSLYYAPEDGRIYPVEHDGNEALSVTNDFSLSPVQGATSSNRPLLRRLLSEPELRQRYLAHLRTVLEESYHPAAMGPLIDEFHRLSLSSIISDPNKSFTMPIYTNDLRVLGEYDDWLELRNLTDQAVHLTGRYLSDEPNNPRKWQFPTGTILPPNGLLMVWLDEDGLAPAGLHASFKLSAEGETIFLTDTDANFNAILDTVTFGLQVTDRTYGRSNMNPANWITMEPTPGQPNN